MWDEVIGHKENKAFLERLVNSGQLPHALLFYGAAGIGKGLVAQCFARALLCLSRQGAKPCEACESCRLLNFATGNRAHPDYLFIEPDPENKVPMLKLNQLQALISQAAYGPRLSGHKVCIINEADSMNTEAANAFLKLLEEPREGWVFILLASNVSRLLPTILSRVIQVRFEPLTMAEAEAVLKKNGLEQGEAAVLARLADGSPGQAMTYHEKGVLALRDAALTYVEALPLAAPIGYLLQNKYFEGLLTTGVEAELYVNMLEYLFRDLLFIKLGLASQLFNCDIEDKLRAVAHRWEPQALKQAVGVSTEAGAVLARRTNVKGVLDNLTLALNDIHEGRA